MENYKKLKTYNTYIKESVNKPGEDVSKEQIDNRIKEIIDGVLKTKQYFEMLQDTAEHVYELFSKNIPPNVDSFLDTIYEKDEILADLIESITDVVINESYCLSELDEIVQTLDKIEKYTENNMDAILSGETKFDEENEEDDDEYEEDEDEIVKPEEDQLKRKPKPIKESLKRKSGLRKKTIEIENFIKKFKKPITDDDIDENIDEFKKGEIVYLRGITGQMAHKFNGLKCIVIGLSENEDDEICYDLYSSSIKAIAENGSNIKGMPKKFIYRKKQENIEDSRRKTAAKKPYKE